MRKLSFKTPPCIVIIDPLSSGMMLASLLVDRGYAVIRVYSSNFPDSMIAHTPKNIQEVEWMGTVYHEDTKKEEGAMAESSSSSPLFTNSSTDAPPPAPPSASAKLRALKATLKKIKAIKGVHIESFMVGCESGVELW
jgi:hypothetical protein